MSADALRGASREEALQTLAKFAKTAPGRLPQRIEDAIALAAQPAPEGVSPGVSLPPLPEPSFCVRIVADEIGVYTATQMQDYARAALAARQGVSLTDEQIVEIRDEHLPSQGDSFDCIAFARAVIRAALAIQGAGKP